MKRFSIHVNVKGFVACKKLQRAVLKLVRSLWVQKSLAKKKIRLQKKGDSKK